MLNEAWEIFNNKLEVVRKYIIITATTLELLFCLR